MSVRDRPQINLPSEDVMADIDADDLRSAPCPRCGYEMFRVKRRVIDLLLTIFTPVHCFRCANLGCGYECNLKNGDEDDGTRTH